MQSAISRNRKRRKLKSEINVVPYIDVMLVLLIIFMVTAPMLTLAVNVELPKSHAKSVESKSDPIIMTVDKDGNYFLKVTKDDKLQAYSPEEISARLKAMVAEQGEDKISVMLAAPGDADYQKVITATALLSESGVKKVGLVSQPGGTGGNAR